MDVPSSVHRLASIMCVGVLLAVCTIAVGEDTPLSEITVEAQRNHEKLQHELDLFVSSVIVAPPNFEDTLWRWNTKICPLVAGLNEDQGEFVLTRLSSIIRSVGAPLGPEKCKPNFYIVVVAEPELLLRKWWHRSVDLFDGESGPIVERFLKTPRPIRFWYSAATVGVDGTFVIGLMDATSVRAKPNNKPTMNFQPSSKGSRLITTSTRDILSVIVVVDSTKVGNISFGQLADYIGLIGLAQVNLDKPLGDAPTILKLFTAQHGAGPAEMTAWDQALLHGLYSTEQTSRTQTSQVKTVALRDIESNSTK
jgi:hypothetical protein